MTHRITADRLVESAIKAITKELFDELQSAAVQRSYIVAKSLPTTFLISTPRCHSGRYIKKLILCKGNYYKIIKVISYTLFHHPYSTGTT